MTPHRLHTRLLSHPATDPDNGQENGEIPNSSRRPQIEQNVFFSVGFALRDVSHADPIEVGDGQTRSSSRDGQEGVECEKVGFPKCESLGGEKDDVGFFFWPRIYANSYWKPCPMWLVGTSQKVSAFMLTEGPNIPILTLYVLYLG